MAASYLLKVVTEFASAHTLRNYPGACSRMHGHNWKVELEVVATGLDDVGMGVDFKAMKTAANEVGARLDHRYLNELEPFTELNPTAENIAAYMYREIAAKLNSDTIRVNAVTLWETDRACVRYSEENVT
ncbi:MAG: 6-carboxytetrahydropterin synthase QueD [Gammaproteobacteria bacterium]|nr:6-carboxytetrahydropterin synthase QueD [Gammaproteobacteria bacterium]NNL06954.1 6-carboxytetrahydropterin synthase QueD [Gammaproteobacteria bacterium]